MNATCPSPDDTPEVVSTACLLDMSEFDVFAAAYRAWYDESAPEAVIERHFVPYMFEGTAPFWVHHFTRETLRAHGVRPADVLEVSPPPSPGAVLAALGAGLELMLLLSAVLAGATPSFPGDGATIVA